MKRIGNILLMTILSLIIVYMSVGATVMHCLRTDSTQLVAFASTIQEEHSCCTSNHKKDYGQSVKSGCMQYHQLKLSPVSNDSNQHFDFTPTLFAIPTFLLKALPKTTGWHYTNKNCKWKYVPHSPPRAYLALIRVLLI